MTQPQLADLAAEYAADWARMVILPERRTEVDAAARRIAGFRPRYEPVEAATRVPWWLIGPLHLREASCDFRGNLANGDTLARRTTHVPAGRPVDGEPPFTWEAAAIDALRYDRLDRVGAWPIEVVCYRTEGYNGFGPRRNGKKSGYLWAGSSIYDGGKYVADGVWDPARRDGQLGVLPVVRRLFDLGLATLDTGSIVVATAAALAETPTTLQQALNTVLAGVPGFAPLAVDGSIGKHTRAAVRLFQTRAGLDDDGIAGPLTWAALHEALGR